MDKLIIHGGQTLRGQIRASGAKNSALPILFASLLSEEPIILQNVPDVVDIRTTLKLLSNIGAQCSSQALSGGLSDTHTTSLFFSEKNDSSDSAVTVHAKELRNNEAPYDLVRTMRASVLCLGPLLARFGSAKVSLPGGCSIGARPVNLHLSALEKLGAQIQLDAGYIIAKAKSLKGAEINFDKVSVGATEHAIMAATLAEGATVIRNAAQEPEITDLSNFLRSMGAKIHGDGTPVIHVEGVSRLSGCTHRVIGDRIEAGTYLIAAAATKGDLEVSNINPEHVKSLLEKLKAAGAEVDTCADAVRLKMSSQLKAVDMSTQPYPGFPTDMQAQFMALMCLAEGSSVISENIFENRFMHVAELLRLGAQISVDGKTAVVKGLGSSGKLKGATVMATDLRASASLVIAGLAAEGETHIRRIYHLDRGYQQMEEKLKKVGARIIRQRE